jgi:hypothetical protein
MKKKFLLYAFILLSIGGIAQIKVYTGGNTCIGSTSHTPGALLDVYSSSGAGSSTQFANATFSHFYSTETKARWGIGRDYLAGGQAAIAFGPGSTTDLDTYIGRDGSGNLVFQTNSSPSTHNTRLTIASGGDVSASGNINLSTATNAYQIGGNKVLQNKNIATCIFVGTDAGNSNTAIHNSALGYRALYTLSTSTCTPNSAFGYKALYNCTSGGYLNDAFGDSALYANTSGASNTGMGAWALTGNTTGGNNVGIGAKASQTNSSGNANTAIGFAALNKNTTSNNTSVGYEALFNTSSGSNNTALGGTAGMANTTGSNNVYVGYGANCNANNYSNSIAIGQGASITASNFAIIGNLSTTSIGGWANWTNYSDQRVKKDVQENVPGLAFIKKLRPVTYHYNTDLVVSMMNIPDSLRLPDFESAKSKILYTGFIAQEVEQAALDLNYDFSGIYKPSDNGLHGLRYAEFVAPLVKAVQEQQAQLDSLKQILAITKTGQRTMQNADPSTDSKGAGSLSSSLPSAQQATLYQNSPNPFNLATTIKCFIPSDSKIASLMVFDMNGTLKKNIAISSRGEVNLTILAKELIAGMYYYSLIIDGAEIDTKKMILTE